MSNDGPSGQKSWIDRLSHLLLREPKDREQLLEVLKDAEHSHILDPDALRMIEGVIQVSQLKVRDIMIPRSQMVVIESDYSLKECLSIIVDSHHSRFPVIDEDRDHIIGILLAKDLLPYSFAADKNYNIKEILRPAIFVPESKPLNVLLHEFRLKRNHMAIVADEYGGVSGFITIEDVLEQIVGEIEDEYDIEENANHIHQLNKNQYTIKALTPIEEFNTYFQTTFSCVEFDTIGGLVIQKFGHMPQRGETIKLDRFQFKVLHADSRRVHLLRVHITPS